MHRPARDRPVDSREPHETLARAGEPLAVSRAEEALVLTTRAGAQQSFDVTLMEEQLVVTERIVPRERIRVRKEILTSEQAVADTVRTAQVELQDAAATGRRGFINGPGERADALAGDQ